MFRSIFLEGLARPFAGVRLILKNLVKRFRSLGGELKLRAGVERIKVEGQRATAVVLENGSELEARRIVSSAGLVETLRMCDDSSTARDSGRRCPFVCRVDLRSWINNLSSWGTSETIVFYNDSDRFHWDSPADELLDVRTGVICSPNNYDYGAEQGSLPDGVVRITSLANYDRWAALTSPTTRWRSCAGTTGWRLRGAVRARLPRPCHRYRHVHSQTIRRFTWHDSGAVYGAPDKRLDGTTHLKNLFLCGNDQGFVGIVGSIISGITIANRHCLRDD